jgi:hypothetical protein
MALLIGTRRLGQVAGPVYYPGRTVSHSTEFARVHALPRRLPPTQAELQLLVTHHTAENRRPNGTQTLRPIQAWGQEELWYGSARVLARGARQGAIFPWGVGSGKTLLTFLARKPYAAQRPVLFTYASLLGKTLRDWAELSVDWDLGPIIPVRTWESLSTQEGADQLELLAPDLIIADEVQAVAHMTAARTNRFLRYFDDNPTTVLVGLSGTITTKSLRDYAHLTELALGENSPTPLIPEVLAEWCEALDENIVWNARRGPGPLEVWRAPGESLREGYRRRLTETPGIVATSADALGTGLEIVRDRSLGTTGPIKELLRELDGTGEWPEGNPLLTPADVARVSKSLALGYWLEWDWGPAGPDREWLEARSGWNRAVAAYLSDGGSRGLDSPGLLARACSEDRPPNPRLSAMWEEWRPQSGKVPPPVVPRFHEGAVAQLAAYVRDWAAQGGGIVWVPGPDIGARLARACRLPHFPAGHDPSTSKAATILASQEAHGKGLNLQRWHRNLVLIPPASGKAWEQLLGRTHRPGQSADTVHCTVLTHHTSLTHAFEGAQSEARYVQATTGNPQKLCSATYL